MKDFVPRPYQPGMVDFMASIKRGNLFAGMGLGKTSACLALLHGYHCVLGEEEPTLVLGPRRVAVSTWPDEAAAWRQFQGLKLVSVTGTAQERAAALRQRAHVYAMNYDNLPWLVEQVTKDGRRWPFKRVIPDESTRLKSFRTRQGGVRAKALGQVAHTHVREWINLTGTPASNGLQDVWGQQWFVDSGERLGRSFSAFQQRWFKPTNMGSFQKWAPLAHAQAEIQARLADCSLTVDPRDWFDLREPIVNVVEVELPTAARARYRELERDMFTRLEQGGEVEALNAAALTSKCLQLANGAAYVDGTTTFEEVHDAKLQALESILEEAAGAPVLVAYHFKSDLARLQRAFPHGRQLDADPETIKAWNAGRVPLLFAHPASAGHGLNLQHGGNTLVFFGQWWDLEQHDQIVERIGPVRQLQAGYDRPVYLHYLVARDTVDSLVMARRSSKRAVQDILLEALKRRAA